MSYTHSNELYPIENQESRVQVRNGMKLVLEDRISKANRTNIVDPLLETLNHIHFDFSDGFCVSVMLQGFVVIDGDLYTGRDKVFFVKERGEILFTIYRSKKSGMLCLAYDEIDLMCEVEKQFHIGIRQLLEELANENGKCNDSEF
jgi:hypothetical protein